jgi:transposase-like protein
MKYMYQLNQIPSEAQIKKTIRWCVFGTTLHCPDCLSRNVCVYQGRYRCKVCKEKFSLFSHTWLSNLKLPLQTFWLVLWCFVAQVPVKQSSKLSRLSITTIRHWFDVFRSKLPEDQNVLEHLVQLDEAYFGGKEVRTLFLGKEIGTRKLAYRILKRDPAREDAWNFLESYVKPLTTLNTDGGSIYHKINNWWPVTHNRDIHKKFEFEHTSEIEGMFGVLRTFVRRMYHHVTRDKLQSVVLEFCTRFSHPEMFENPQSFLQITLHIIPTRC